MTLGSDSRSIRGLIQVAIRDRPHAGEVLDKTLPELNTEQDNRLEPLMPCSH